jgi:hypothetical protein
MYYAKHSSMNGIIICIDGEKRLMNVILTIISADQTMLERALLPLFQTFFYAYFSI